MGKPVFLLTDILIYLLLGLTLLFAWYASRHEHLSAPWRRVAKSRTAQGAMVVLGFYVVVGLLDSLHYQPRLDTRPNGEAIYSGEVRSLFDWLAEPLRANQEKTYSAPLAVHLYAKETIELPDGTTIRGYPRLDHAGAHLADPAERWAEIRQLAEQGIAGAVLVWGSLALLLGGLTGRARGTNLAEGVSALLRGRTRYPWHAALWTLLLLLLLVGLMASIGSHYHLLGTDKVGEDVLYQALKSIRTGLMIGTLTTLVMLPAAILLGIMAGYFKGWIDDVIQYLYTTLNAIPGVLLIAAAILMLHIYLSNHADEFTSVTERADLRLLFLCLILGTTSWTGLCRLLRGETFKLRELEYVQAAQAFGVRDFTILHRHVLPNVLHIVLITVVIDFSGLVLAEAVLSYINIGVDPSMDSWGNMINGARLELAREPIVWWSLAAAFLFMFTLVLAANLFADVVRDAFDPRLRSSR
jgi:peptide/nickel transport system permease protein